MQVSGRRYYSPGLGRWVNRDPIGEHSAFLRIAKGGSKRQVSALLVASRSPAYLFVGNAQVSSVDFLGLYGFGTLREQCCIWWAVRGTGLGTIILIHELATEMGRELQADTSITLPVGWGPGDATDAVRHCAGACMLTASFGPARALAVLECHEEHGPHTWGIEMDRWNNDRGIELGDTSPPPSPTDCRSRCREALENGELRRDDDFH